MYRGMVYCLLEAFIQFDQEYTALYSLCVCVLIFDKVDKPKQNGSADGEDAQQGSKQGEHV